MAVEQDAFPKTLSLITHELATPLSVAAGYVRMLLREQAGPLNEKQRKMLEEVEHSCSRIGGLLNEIKDLRKLISDEITLARQTFDFAALVEELASDMHEGRDRGVTLELRRPDGPLEVEGDRKRLADAVRTLFRASLRERGLPGVLVAQLSRVNGSPPAALLTIGDESFRQALGETPGADFDGWRGGVGAVLRIAKWVVEAHGGQLWSAADPDRDRTRAGWSGGTAMRIPLKG